MSIIKDPIALARQISREYQQCYGNDLVAVIVYGSAAGAEFNQKSSDINLLIVLKDMALATLEKSQALQDAWIKKRFNRPLFIDRNYIAGSLDSFPIEFFNMRHSYVVAYGEDVLAQLVIKPEDLRLQIERELKGKWLHLQREWLDTRKNDRRLRTLAELSLKDFTAIFRAMLFLKNEPVPQSRKALFSAVTSLYTLADNPFERVMEALANGDRVQMRTVFPQYSQAINDLIKNIDQQTAKEHL
jgi:hypothetical protein